MAYYDICQDCGGTLEPGEKCDCREETIYSSIRKRSQIKERNIYVKKMIISLRAGRAIKKAAGIILIVLAELLYSLSITYFTAKWAIEYAYSVRGYEAYGGEYILIIMVFGISFGSIHVFLKLLKREDAIEKE